MRLATLILIFCLTLVLNGCSYQETKGGPDGDLGGLDLPPGATIDFAMINSQILSNDSTGKCSKCHAWATSYTQVAGKLSSIKDRVARAPGSPGAMPKDGPPLADELKALLFAWIDAGAPEFGTTDGDGGENPPDPIPPPELENNWDSISRNIIEPYCLKCHREPDFLNDGVVLVTYDDVFSKSRRIRKEVVDRSMPEDTKLPDELLNALVKWIDSGLPR